MRMSLTTHLRADTACHLSKLHWLIESDDFFEYVVRPTTRNTRKIGMKARPNPAERPAMAGLI